MFIYASKQVCLSKGLGAPVGSVIVDSKSFITKARWLRKTLGGGMRQVGVLCAAAYVALHDNVGGLNQIRGLKVDPASIETNMIFFDISEASNFMVEKLSNVLEEHGILMLPESSSSFRIFLHHQISDDDIQYTLSCIQQAILQLQVENN